MKKSLTKSPKRCWYFVDGKRIDEVSPYLSGDVSGLSGDVSGLSGNVSGMSGDVSGLSGDVSGLSGDVSGLSGDVSGLSGDVDDSEITDAERAKGIEISALIIDG